MSVAVLCFVACRFSGESLAYAGDDGVVGIISLHEGITVRTNIWTYPGKNQIIDSLVRKVASY